MRERSSFASSHIIAFRGSITADAVEDQLVEFYLSVSNHSEPLLLDFAETTYIDIPVLVNIIAHVAARRDRNQETYIGVPRGSEMGRAVRDLLRAWRFPQAFLEATNIPFREVLVAEDQRNYWAEGQSTYMGFGTGIDKLEYNVDWKKGQRGRRNFFEFMSYHGRESSAPSVKPGAIARNEGLHWNGEFIQQVLKTHLCGKGSENDIARVIIWETLSNAVRHPNAGIIQIVSRFERNRSVTFSAGDIKDLTLFANGLKQKKGALSSLLAERLSERTLASLNSYESTLVNTEQLRALLVKDLNVIVKGPALYDAQLFSSISLRPETLHLLQQNHRNVNSDVLNRLLLEDAYPMELSKKYGAPVQLRISVWDDGKEIISTLRPLIDKGLAIRSVRPPEFPEPMYDNVFIRTRQWGGDYDAGQVVNQGDDPTPQTPDAIVLLSSLYPGISQAVSISVPSVEEMDDDAKVPVDKTVGLAKRPGMGLYFLTRAVVDRHTGSLTLRTGRHLLQLELSHDKYTHQHHVRYKAKVTRFPDQYPSFKGNLLTIELPLQS